MGFIAHGRNQNKHNGDRFITGGGDSSEVEYSVCEYS